MPYYKNIPVEIIVELPDKECVIQFEDVHAGDDYYKKCNPPKLVVSQDEITDECIDFDYETQKAREELNKLKSQVNMLKEEYYNLKQSQKREQTSLIDTTNRMQKSFETLCSLTKQQQEKYDSLILKIKELEEK